jgi:hypothetical protein
MKPNQQQTRAGFKAAERTKLGSDADLTAYLRLTVREFEKELGDVRAASKAVGVALDKKSDKSDQGFLGMLKELEGSSGVRTLHDAVEALASGKLPEMSVRKWIDTGALNRVEFALAAARGYAHRSPDLSKRLLGIIRTQVISMQAMLQSSMKLNDTLSRAVLTQRAADLGTIAASHLAGQIVAEARARKISRN